MRAADEAGHKQIMYHDPHGRVTRTEEFEGSVPHSVQLAYGPLNELLTITDQLENVTTLDWDGLGRLTATHDPDRGDRMYEYDDAGNMTARTDSKGTRIEITYDALNRIRTKQIVPSGMATVWKHDDPLTCPLPPR